MMKWFAACVIATLLSRSAVAADIALIQENKQLGIIVTGLQFPNTLSKDLISGLTNRIFVRASLVSNTQSLANKTIDITVKYDLWEETFQLTMRNNDIQVATNHFANVQQVIAFLEHLQLNNLFSTQALTGNQEFVVKVDVLINPIDRERMAKVRKWVADNSTYLPNQQGSAVENSAANARPNELFNKIFEQYAAGVDLAAAWKETMTSKPFTLDRLGDAK